MHLSFSGLPAICLTLAATVLAQPPIDFSCAGYGGGGVAIPVAPAVISVRPSGGDDTQLLQGAIDQVSALPLGDDGFRGAVLLRPGQYRVAGKLEIRAGGIVLRGSGAATIVAAGKGRRTLIEAGGAADRSPVSPRASPTTGCPRGAECSPWRTPVRYGPATTS